MIGWRFWLATAAGNQAALCSPFHGQWHDGEFITNERWFDEVLTGPVTLRARCWKQHHAAPAPACECGWRVIDRRRDLVDWLLRRVEDPMIYEAVALVRVRSVGVAIADQEDKLDGFRAERLQILGPIMLSPGLLITMPDAVLAFCNTFRVPCKAGAESTAQSWLETLAAESVR